jgi:hypothetical protein
MCPIKGKHSNFRRSKSAMKVRVRVRVSVRVRVRVRVRVSGTLNSGTLTINPNNK